MPCHLRNALFVATLKYDRSVIGDGGIVSLIGVGVVVLGGGEAVGYGIVMLSAFSRAFLALTLPDPNSISSPAVPRSSAVVYKIDLSSEGEREGLFAKSMLAIPATIGEEKDVPLTFAIAFPVVVV